MCCGNGLIARRLARQGALVTAFDFSSTMVAAATGRSAATAPAIDYRVIDATDGDELRSLGRARRQPKAGAESTSAPLEHGARARRGEFTKEQLQWLVEVRLFDGLVGYRFSTGNRHALVAPDVDAGTYRLGRGLRD